MMLEQAVRLLHDVRSRCTTWRAESDADVCQRLVQVPEGTGVLLHGHVEVRERLQDVRHVALHRDLLPAHLCDVAVKRLEALAESLEALAATLEGYKLENLPAWKNVQVDAGQQAWTQPLPTRAVWDVD